MNFEEWSKTAEYEQLNRFTNAGDETQVCRLTFPDGNTVTERTWIPYCFGKQIQVKYIVDLVLPVMSECEDKVIELKGKLSDAYYTEIGFGMPEFDKLENAFAFAEWYSLNKKEV